MTHYGVRRHTHIQKQAPKYSHTRTHPLTVMEKSESQSFNMSHFPGGGDCVCPYWTRGGTDNNGAIEPDKALILTQFQAPIVNTAPSLPGGRRPRPDPTSTDLHHYLHQHYRHRHHHHHLPASERMQNDGAIFG